MEAKDENIPVIVYSGSAVHAQMIRAFIESAGIQAFVQDEMSGILAPYMVSAGGIGAVKVIVASHDAEQARILVDEFLSNLK